MHRRTFLACGTAVLATQAAADTETFEIERTPAEWRARLTEMEYAVMREEATEEPFSSPLLAEDRPGTYDCKGCGLPLYASDTKFESGTGWPSFYQSLPDAIRTKEDRSFLFIVRTECHCRRCGCHLGHIFDDGPPPTGKRHCLNGIALTFSPASA